MSGIQMSLLGSSGFTPVTNTYDIGSGDDTIPMGASQVVIEIWGSGGSGSGSRIENPMEEPGVYSTGYGGGSGGYVSETQLITPANWGQTLSYSVGASVAGGALHNDGITGNNTTCSNNTFTSPFSLVAHGGGGGATGAGFLQGTGGFASGGDINMAGNGGGDPIRAGAGAPYGNGDAGTGVGTAPGGGGAGGSFAGSAGAAGAAGRVRFKYT